ncbi:hypothetical protein E1288_35930 [Saccharopolyspora elongata]|uniref:Uncharacterized protein n=1 Tax=Saccharopolyspora elongata TaxID=2530387 RepID=A0A4R4Y8N6_9PSEU|nr:hypothetical protein E1288_35930 [Saccharopolyspora elongata]
MAPPYRRRPQWTASEAAVCLGFFMILLDGSALNVALPATSRTSTFIRRRLDERVFQLGEKAGQG